MKYIFTLMFFLLMSNGLYAYSTPLAILPIPAPTTPRIVMEIEGNESISSKNVKDQLKELAEEVKSDENITVYIISYSRPTHPKEANRRASLVKNQLVKKYRIASTRIVTVNGGIDENRKIVIYFVPSSANPPNDSAYFDAHKTRNLVMIFQYFVVRDGATNKVNLIARFADGVPELYKNGKWKVNGFLISLLHDGRLEKITEAEAMNLIEERNSKHLQAA